MSRTTHDRIRDHDGLDLDTNVALDGALSAPASTADGDTVHQALTDLNGVIAGLPLGKLPQYASAPHSGTETEGESYYDTTAHKTYTWDGTTWQGHW
jgi:hypothetical protein